MLKNPQTSTSNNDDVKVSQLNAVHSIGTKNYLTSAKKHPKRAIQGDVYYNTVRGIAFVYNVSKWIPIGIEDIVEKALVKLREHQEGTFKYTKKQLRKIICDAYADNFDKIKILKEFKL